MLNSGFTLFFSKYKSKFLLLTTSLIISLLVGVTLLEFYYNKVYKDEWGLQFDKDLGWSPIPSNSYSQEGIRATTNSSGFRSEEVDYTKKTILLIGDSIAYGAFVNDNETMGSNLQKKFGNYQVVNLGVPGYGLGQYYLRLKKHIKTLNPEKVLVVIGNSQDAWDTSVNYTNAAKPYFVLKDKNKVYDKSGIDRDNLLLIDDHVRKFSCYNIFASSQTLRFSGLSRLQNYFCPRITTKYIELRYVIKALLLKIQNLVLENGSKLTYILSPDRFAFKNYKTKNKLLKQATQGLPKNLIPEFLYNTHTTENLMWKKIIMDMGIDHIDLLPIFMDQGLTPKELFISWRYDNFHYSVEGNQYVANAIYNHFK
jgi:hypothetical protein